jgi:hypothetical protein
LAVPIRPTMAISSETPMKLPKTLLMAAFSLIMSAITAQAADIPITYLPFTIATAGKYVLNADLTFSVVNSVYTLTVSASNVTIDLRGIPSQGEGVF